MLRPIHLLLPIPFVKTLGDGRAEKCVPFLDFPNRGAYTAGGRLFEQITHRTGVDRLQDIRFVSVRRKKEHFGRERLAESGEWPENHSAAAW